MRPAWNGSWAIGGAVVLSLVACNTATSTPTNEPPPDPKGCTYDGRYYARADYPNGFLSDDGCHPCSCDGCQLPDGFGCTADPPPAAQAGPSRLSLDKVSCKVTREQLTIEGDGRPAGAGWTMVVEGSCHAATVQITIRDVVAEDYPRDCLEGATAEVALTIDGSTSVLGGRKTNSSCTIASGPAPHPAGGTPGTPWPTFLAAVRAGDGADVHTVAYRAPYPAHAPVYTNVDGGVSPGNP